MARERNDELRALAQGVADALPVEVVAEVVLTGSVSRGMADDVSDVEMLVVTRVPLALDACFALAGRAGLDALETWGPQDGPTRRVFGLRRGVPVETTWWSGEQAEAEVDAILAGTTHAAADALVHGVALRTGGGLATWQERLSTYPAALAAAKIEEAALPWGGFAPAGLLTLVRPGGRLALSEWMVDGAVGVLAIVFALNRVWQPSTKRVAARVAPLRIKPDRLAERLEGAFAEPDPLRALLALTEVQLDAVRLAPSGPNVDRARAWLEAGAAVLRS